MVVIVIIIIIVIIVFTLYGVVFGLPRIHVSLLEEGILVTLLSHFSEHYFMQSSQQSA